MIGHERVPKLPGDVQALLDVERDLPALGDDVQQRLRRRLEMSVGILALGVGAAAVASTGASTGATAATGTAGVTKVALLSKPWVIAAIAFVLGGVAGAGLHAYARNAPPPARAQVTTVVVERRIEVPVPAPVTAPLPETVTVVPSQVETTASPAMAPQPPTVAGAVTPGAQSGAAAA
ncbi:MAG: hypothetical protein ABI175_11305, partial [Polyangiales bacterium]